MNVMAVNTVMMAPSTTTPNVRTATLTVLPPSTVTTAAELINETALLTTTMDTTIATANTTAVDTNDANSTMHINTATAVSPTNEPFTYSRDEVQQLLEDARLDGRKGLKKDTGQGGNQGTKKEEKMVMKWDMTKEARSGEKDMRKGTKQDRRW